MTRRRPKNVGASVRDRLLRRSRESGEDFQFLLVRYANERFLYRLGESSHRDRFVLKGAMLFTLWRGSIYRPTRDVDLTGRGCSAAEDVLAALREVCTVPFTGDGLTFSPGTLTAKPIRNDAEYDGLRILLQAVLSGARIPMQIDIGFGNAIVPPAAVADYPTLLEGQPSPRILAYQKESVVAEKLHAMVGFGERNSRYKDFYDLYLLARQFAFDGGCLTRAIGATFQRRNTIIEAAAPAALTARFFADGARAELWRASLMPGTPTSFIEVGELLLRFLLPPWRALADGSKFSGVWKPLGPWSSEMFIEEIVGHAQNARQTERPGRYKPYAAYRDSGVEWLGDIPAHWEMKHIRQAVSRRVTDGAHISPDTSSPDFPFISTVDIQGGVIDFENCLGTSATSFAYMNRTGCTPRCGDVLFSKDGTVGTTSIVTDDRDFAVASSLVIISPDLQQMGPNWLNYWLNSGFIRNGLDELLSGAALRRISVAKVSRLPLLLPPKKGEQSDITSFLDRETAQIDALVARKERLIELLQEKRRALISRAVTKGLDLNVPVKFSGVEWLGNVPAHWKVERIRDIAEDLQTGPFGSQLHAQDYILGGSPVINPVNLRNNQLVQDHETTVDEDVTNRLSRHRVREGDILFARRGELGRCGLVTKRQEGWLCGTGCLRLRVNFASAKPQFLIRLLSTTGVAEWLKLQSVGATMLNLNTSVIGRIPIVLPPTREQEAIALFLDEETAKIDSLIAKIHEAIDHLKEYRTALITAAVTGKIDVREEVA